MRCFPPPHHPSVDHHIDGTFACGGDIIRDIEQFSKDLDMVEIKKVMCSCGKELCDPKHGPAHHDDGTFYCETNFRTIEEQCKREDGKVRWNMAMGNLPNLKVVMRELEKHYNPLDAHTMFLFVQKDPESASIALARMFRILGSIHRGQKALDEIAMIGD